MIADRTTLPGAQLDALTIDQYDAARLTGLSAKTLERLSAAGEPVGRVKIGRRVLFIRAQLESWLLSRLSATETTPPRCQPRRKGGE